MQTIYHALKRMNGFFRYSKTDSRRVHADEGKTQFYDIFKVIVPKEFTHDRILAQRVGDLCKFVHLTYNVYNSQMPFFSYDRPTSYAKFKRSIHKQIKLYHGI